MSRFRKLDLRLWADERFVRLSPQKPSAQALLIYLTAGPSSVTTQIPGLIMHGPDGLARKLGWSLRATRQCFDELIAANVVMYDKSSDVTWVPMVFEYSPPDNPSVVQGWRDLWFEVPPSPLKSHMAQWITSQLTPKCAEAAADVFGLASAPGRTHGGGHGVRDGVPHRGGHKEKEKDKDQEQDSKTPLTPQGGECEFATAREKTQERKKNSAGRPRAEDHPDLAPVADGIIAHYRRVVPRIAGAAVPARDRVAVLALLLAGEDEETLRGAANRYARGQDCATTNSRGVHTFYAADGPYEHYKVPPPPPPKAEPFEVPRKRYTPPTRESMLATIERQEADYRAGIKSDDIALKGIYRSREWLRLIEAGTPPTSIFGPAISPTAEDLRRIADELGGVNHNATQAG